MHTEQLFFLRIAFFARTTVTSRELLQVLETLDFVLRFFKDYVDSELREVLDGFDMRICLSQFLLHEDVLS